MCHQASQLGIPYFGKYNTHVIQYGYNDKREKDKKVYTNKCVPCHTKPSMTEARVQLVLCLPHQHPVMQIQQQARATKMYVDVVSQKAYAYNTGSQKFAFVRSAEILP